MSIQLLLDASSDFGTRQTEGISERQSGSEHQINAVLLGPVRQCCGHLPHMFSDGRLKS